MKTGHSQREIYEQELNRLEAKYARPITPAGKSNFPNYFSNETTKSPEEISSRMRDVRQTMDFNPPLAGPTANFGTSHDSGVTLESIMNTMLEFDRKTCRPTAFVFGSQATADMIKNAQDGELVSVLDKYPVDIRISDIVPDGQIIIVEHPMTADPLREFMARAEVKMLTALETPLFSMDPRYGSFSPLAHSHGMMMLTNACNDSMSSFDWRGFFETSTTCQQHERFQNRTHSLHRRIDRLERQLKSCSKPRRKQLVYRLNRAYDKLAAAQVEIFGE